MRKRIRIILTAALVAWLLPQVQQVAECFEIFPRPAGQYTVRRGETLFGLAEQLYTNKDLWPFLWNQNPSIRIDESVAAPQEEPLKTGTTVNFYDQRNDPLMTSEDYREPTGLSERVRYYRTVVPFEGIPFEKQLFKYRLGPRKTRLWGYLVASPEVYKEHFLEQDLVYVRFRPSKRQCVMVGDRFGIYREDGPIPHPLNSDRSIGYIAEIVGELEITNVGHELVTAIILDSYVEIERGDKVCLYVPTDKQIVASKTHRMMVGTILYSATRRDAFYADTQNLERDVVFVDRGERDGLKEGTLLNIYRPTSPVQDPAFPHRRVAIPDRYVGEGIVLKTFARNSSVLITRAKEEVIPGDVIKTVSD
jgi:hypothetical protein